jgi:hypothetical protein
MALALASAEKVIVIIRTAQTPIASKKFVPHSFLLHIDGVIRGNQDSSRHRASENLSA